MESHRPTDDSPSRRERAVSDVIGFSLMFGIIIVGVGVVSVGGLNDILDFGDREEITTSERGMEAAAATLDKINSQSDWNRSFSLVVGTGNVWLNDSELTISGADGIENDIGDGGTIPVNSLEHRFDRQPQDVSVRYESGAVFRSDSVAASYRPSFKCNGDTDTALVSVVNLTAKGSGINVAVDYNRQFTIDPTSIPDQSPVAAFAETLTLQADLQSWETHTRTGLSSGQELRLDVSGTANPAAWAYYLENRGWTPDPADGGTFTCDADTVVVREMTVGLRRLI